MSVNTRIDLGLLSRGLTFHGLSPAVVRSNGISFVIRYLWNASTAISGKTSLRGGTIYFALCC